VSAPFWSILICAIQQRQDSLLSLLSNLALQVDEHPVEVVVCLDNGAAGGGLTYPAKSQKLLDSSSATFVSFIDDDDDVATDFIPAVMGGLGQYRLQSGEWPHYVGFAVNYTVDGIRQLPVHHSLAYGGWNRIDDRPAVLTRDIVQFNPIQREIALLGRWEEPGWQADFRWANQVRASGRCVTQVYIPQELYYKRDYSTGDFRAGHSPVPGPPGPLPDAPWLRWI